MLISPNGLMPPFQLGPMVLNRGEKLLVVDLPERSILSVLDEEPEMIEQLAKTNVRGQFAQLADSFEQLLLGWGDHGIMSPIESSPA